VKTNRSRLAITFNCNTSTRIFSVKWNPHKEKACFSTDSLYTRTSLYCTSTNLYRTSTSLLHTSTNSLHTSTNLYRTSTNLLYTSTSLLYTSTNSLHTRTNSLHTSTDLFHIQAITEQSHLPFIKGNPLRIIIKYIRSSL
jgi:hypothetical protein